MKIKKLIKFVLVLIPVCAGVGIGLFFFVTSSYFLVNHVLPRVSSAAGVGIEAKRIELSLFSSHLKVEDLLVGDRKKPLVKDADIEVSYGLREIIGGKIKLDKIRLAGAEISISRDASGRWNFPSGGTSKPSGDGGPKGGGTSAKSAEKILDISNISLENLKVDVEIAKSAAESSKITIDELNFSCARIANGAKADVQCSGNVAVESGEDLRLGKTKLDIKLSSELDGNLTPNGLVAEVTSDPVSGIINGQELSGLAGKIMADIIPDGANGYDIKGIKYEGIEDGKASSKIAVSGKLDVEPFSVDLDVSADPISPSLLNLAAGIFSDYSFGGTSLCMSGNFKYSRGGSISSNGNIAVSNFSFADIGKVIPGLEPLDIRLDYDIGADIAAKKMDIGKLKCEVAEKEKNLLSLSLAGPSTIEWLHGSMKFSGSNPGISLSVRDFNLLRLNPFITGKGAEDLLKSGTLDADINAEIADSEGGMSLAGNLKVKSLWLKAGGLEYSGLDVESSFSTQLEKLSEMKLDKLEVAISEAGKKLLSLAAAGVFDTGTGKGHVGCALSAATDSFDVILPKGAMGNKHVAKSLGIFKGGTFDLKTASEFSIREEKINCSELKAGITSSEKGITLELVKPFPFCWAEKSKGGDNILNLPFYAKLALKNIQAAEISLFIPESAEFKLQHGEIDAEIAGGMTVAGKDMKMLFSISGDDLAMNFKGGQTENIKLCLSGHLDMPEYTAMKLSNFQVDMKVKDKEEFGLCLKNAATMDFKKGAYDFDVNIDRFDADAANCILTFFGKEPKIAGMGIKGRLNASLSGGTASAAGNLKISDFSITGMPKNSEPFSGEIELDIKKDTSLLCVNRCLLDVSSGKKYLANLDVAGKISLQKGKGAAGPDTVSISSKGVDIKAIADIFAGGKRQEAPEAPGRPKKTEEAKPKTDDSATSDFLKESRILATLDLKNLSYGPEYYGELAGKVSIDSGVITADPVQVVFNGLPLDLKGELATDDMIAPAYKLEVGAKQLPLAALFKAASGKNMPKEEVRGVLDSFRLSVSGKGFTGDEIGRSLTGDLSADFKDISFPLQSLDNVYVQFVFMPIKLLANASSFFPKIQNYKGLSDASNAAKNILKNTQNVEFSDGAVRISAAGGTMKFDKFLFNGKFFKYMTMSGGMDYPQPFPLKVSSELSAGGIIVPVDIGGTAAEPKVDMKTFIPAFFAKNALGIITPENVGQLLEGAAKGGKGFMESLGKVMLKPLEGGQDAGKDPGAEPAPKPKPGKGDNQDGKKSEKKEKKNALEDLFKLLESEDKKK